MRNIDPKIALLWMTFLMFATFPSNAQESTNSVEVVGQMRNVMWKGELSGIFDLNTIANKTDLYGLGPVEYLAGEILIVDGKAYKSTVVSDTKMKVEETFNIKAPFFAYANISAWKKSTLPDTVQTIQQLEEYLDKLTETSNRPFVFKLAGKVDQATIHIVNLPKGSKVSSPDDAHVGQTSYELKDESSEIIGFFSTAHKAIFTHHNTFLHMHLITSDRKKMGHLDKALFKKGTMTLYLPKE